MIWWALKGTVILALAFAATTLLRRRPAAIRHAIWTVALAAQLLVPLASRIDTRGTLAVAVPTRMVSLSNVPTTMDAGPFVAMEPVPGGQASATKGLRVDLTMILLAGSVVLVLRLLIGILQVATISRRATRVHDGQWLALCERICDELGIRRPVTLMYSDRIALPVTFGIVYPVVLLPRESHAGWSASLRRHVLLHELGHVRRGDALTQLVAQSALAFFWFNPLLWLAVRRMRAEAENACDDYVLRDGERPSRYATSLVELVEAQVRTSPPAIAALSVGSRSDLYKRVEAIMHPLRDASLRRALCAAVVAGAIAVVLPLAAVHPRQSGERASKADARASLGCRPVFVDGEWFNESSGMMTMNGRTTHYFFLRPDPDRCLEASFSLDATFAPDDHDLVAAPGLDALVREVLPGLDRALYVREEGGRLARRYVVNGRETPWDARAARWYAGVLPDVIRRTAAGVEDRASRLLAAGNLSGFLGEVGRMELVDVRRRYLAELLVLRHPDELSRDELLRKAKPLLGSHTPTWAAFLGDVVERDGARADVRRAVLEELARIEPEVERVAVVRTLLLHRDASAREDGERATTLLSPPFRRELLR